MRPSFYWLIPFLVGAGLAFPALAQQAGESGPPPDAGDADDEKLGFSMPDLSEDPKLMAAAELQPAQPEVVAQALPETLAGLERTALDARLHEAGPAALAEVRATYSRASAVLRVYILDPAGLPQVGPQFLDLPEPGVIERVGGRTRTGLEVAGFPAVHEVDAESASRWNRLQVKVGPRIRVTLLAKGLTPAQVEEAAQAIDLAALAGLASEEPPDLSRARKQPQARQP